MRALREKLIDLWRARELLARFVRKELTIRYKNSALGFLWSLLTPALMTAIFTVLFRYVIRIEVADFAAFFLAGYLSWQFFQNSVQSSIHSIVGNGDLIKKVFFPREVLPLSHVLAQLIHLLLALVATMPYFVWTRGWGVLTHLPVLLIGIGLLALFTCGVAMAFASANVPFRDLQELIVVIFLLWFYATPVLYPLVLVETSQSLPAVDALQVVVLLNPMTWFVQLVRTGLYGLVVTTPDAVTAYTSLPPAWPPLDLLAICFSTSWWARTPPRSRRSRPPHATSGWCCAAFPSRSRWTPPVGSARPWTGSRTPSSSSTGTSSPTSTSRRSLPHTAEPAPTPRWS